MTGKTLSDTIYVTGFKKKEEGPFHTISVHASNVHISAMVQI